MTQRVVDGLEAIEIDEMHRQLIAVAGATGQGLGQRLLEQHAVGQFGQRIIMGQAGDLRLGPLALGDVLGDAQQVGGLAVGVADGDLLGAEDRHAAVRARHVIFLDHPHLARQQHLAVTLDIERGQFGVVDVGVGLADHLVARHAQRLLAGPVQQDIAMVVGALDEDHRGHRLDDRRHEGLGALHIGLGGGECGHAPAVRLVGGLQQPQHGAHAQIAAALGDDEAAQQVRGPVGQAVGGERRQLGVGVDDQRLAVHQRRDRAVGVERAAVLGRHAQEEGVAFDDADRSVLVVQHRNNQGVGLFPEALVQRLAKNILTRGRQGRHGVPKGEHGYASTWAQQGPFLD